MSRYRRYKPTRQEVRAALDLYKPYHEEGAIMSKAAIGNQELYKPGICWWTIKGNRQTDAVTHIHGIPATLRTVEKYGYQVNMYLCDKHAKRMIDNGYSVTVA